MVNAINTISFFKWLKCNFDDIDRDISIILVHLVWEQKQGKCAAWKGLRRSAMGWDEDGNGSPVMLKSSHGRSEAIPESTMYLIAIMLMMFLLLF